MLGLLYKDCFIYIKSKAWISLLFYYFIALGTLLFSNTSIGLLIMVMFALANGLTYLVWLDDKYNAPLFLSALNIHRSKLLLSRYIVITIITLLFIITISIPILLFSEVYQTPSYILRLLYYLCFVYLQLGIDMYIINHLGYKSRWVLYIVNTIIGFVAGYSYGYLFFYTPLIESLSGIWLGVLLLFIGLLIWYSSYVINAKLYEKIDL
ncbi:ABC-2 transporter permease [Vallitalea okinawensis]|uniref:ABC-2 transporter permease n=1 Tax=Vallitalea okinawensis TaxID=2078660 RepID=UPI000CFB2575|nr:ABC-2 transporter permease [Vallitalea okinawensis]